MCMYETKGRSCNNRAACGEECYTCACMKHRAEAVIIPHCTILDMYINVDKFEEHDNYEVCYTCAV